MKWTKGLDSAPKDGTLILVCERWTLLGTVMYVLIGWSEDRECWCIDWDHDRFDAFEGTKCEYWWSPITPPEPDMPTNRMGKVDALEAA